MGILKHFTISSSELDIIRLIKSGRLLWIGRVEESGENGAAKRAYRGQPTGRYSVGSPRCRWKGKVAKDLKRLND